MKIGQSAYTAEGAINNEYAKKRLGNGEKPAEKGMVKNGSINAAGLNLFDDEIANKKQKAIQDAMQFVKEQFEADNEIDDVMEVCRENAAKSRENLKEANEALGVLEEEKEKMKEACGGEETEEYKEYLKDYEKETDLWKERKENAQKDIVIQTATIGGIKQEMLKHHGMDDAEKAKEMMLKAAGKEVTGMLIEEAKNKIDETIGDAVEKGEEKKEETEEIEGKLEEIQAEQKRKAKEIEESSEKSHKNSTMNSGSAYKPVNMDRLQKEIVRHTNEIIEMEMLLPEDLKGAVIDDIL